MAYDGNKLTKVEALKALAERVNSDFITKAEAQKQIKQEVAQAGHAKFEKVETLPEVADAQQNIMYLLYNEKTKHYDIYAKIGESMEQLDDTTVDLSGYVTKEEGKELIATEKITKLDGIAEGATKVEQSQTKGNIKINEDEVTVFEAEIATDAEVTEILDEVLSSTTHTPDTQEECDYKGRFSPFLYGKEV